MNSLIRFGLLGLALLATISLFAQSNAPANLKATATTYNQIDLAWDDKSTNETKFEIERIGLTGSFIKIGEASANSPSYQDKTVTSLNTYSYRVRAVFVTSTSTYSNTLTVSTPQEPPGTPTGLTATLQNGSVVLSWSNGSGGTATSYRVERSVQGGAYSLYQTVQYSRTPGLTDNGVQGGQQYCYRVQAINGGGSSGYAGPTCQTIPLSPTNIKNLIATTVSSSSIKLNWTPYGKESGITIERRKGQSGNFDKIKDWLADSGEFIDTGLESNTEYCYRIGESGHDYSATVCKTTSQSVPTAPARMQAQAIAYNRIDLQWADLSSNESRFEIERATGGSTASYTKIADVGPNTQTYSDQSVQANTQYCYRVRAVNDAGNSGYNDPPACTTTPAPPAGIPQNVKAVATSTTQISLSWDAVSGASGYQLERSLNGTDGWQQIGPSPATATTFVDNGRSPNTRYYYRVRALNSAGAPGDYSGVVNAITPDVPPADPARLTITAFTYNQVSLQWADLSGNETGFQVDRSPDGTSWTKIGDVAQNATTYTDQSVAPQTHYYYRVRAVNAAGLSNPSNTVDVTTPVGPPIAAQDLKATATSTTQISLSWSAIPNAVTIVIERSPDGAGSWNPLTTVAGTTTTYTDNGLTPNTRYYYRIRATNVSGTGPNSNVADALTPDVPPKEPAGLTAKVISTSQINLSWTDQSTNESGFELERATGTNGSFQKIADLPANTTTYEDKALADNTQYCYRVRAKNAAGPSAYTDPACATTPLAPPGTPVNLTAEVVDYDQVKLNWPAVSASAVNVRIERSTSPSGPFQEIKTVPASQTTYTDAGLQEFTTYYYRIQASNTAGSSGFSNVAQAQIKEILIAVEDEWLSQTQVFVADQTLHIQTDWHQSSQALIQLHSLAGRVHLNDSRRVLPAAAWTYALGQLPTGVYIVAIHVEGRIFTKRILLP
ncbi:fibronectin type III domain-containing protein [Spirosoma aerolatum]|uniref:fibronectin type III domain-containing protein n=1 Tax=Spirosoma aerolatum TaxID=1211326 RepID=UPI0009AE1662|nr:fibronectin type III domain-containing protein [Spirosoma aerolatum]